LLNASKRIRIALAQQRIQPDKEVNIMKGLSLIKRAIQVKADLVVLPEVFNTGFYVHNYQFVDELEDELRLLLKLSEGREMVIIAGVAEKCGEKMYNSAVIIRDGEIVGKYRKTHLFPLTSEGKYFEAGSKLEVFETPVGRIGILICYEIRFPELSRKLTKLGAEMIVVPAEFPKVRIDQWRTLLKARAIENQLYVVGVNCVEGDLDYGGHSLVVDPMGSVLIEGGEYQEVAMIDVDLNYIEKVRQEYPFLEDLREEIL